MSLDWGNVPEWLAAIATAGAVGVAFRQLIKVAQASQSQADVSRAQLMLEIDQIFEGTELLASRMAIQSLSNHNRDRWLLA